MKFKTLMTTMVMGSLAATQALAWGDVGHRMIGEEAMRALPDYMPAFLRSAQGIADMGELAREPDRSKNSGKVHDSERDPAHFIDLDDDGNSIAGIALDNLPATKSDFEAATRAKGMEPYKSGYLPYALVDAYQQVVKDMGMYRVVSFLASKETDKTKKAWYRADMLRRQELMKRDIGYLAHYVGDSSQPLHLSIHYNGWGQYPNPQNFSQDHVHAPIESTFVAHNMTAADVRPLITPYKPCTDRIDLCFAVRLKSSWTQTVPMYQLYKDGGFTDGDTRGKVFIAQLLAKGVSELRDALVDAWRDSKSVGVGYPTKDTTYDDFVGGKVVDPWLTLHGE